MTRASRLLTATPTRRECPRTALVLKADRLSGESLRYVLDRALPGIDVSVATRTKDASAILASRAPELFLTGLESSSDGDVLELLSGILVQPSHPRVLVITAEDDARALAVLPTLAVCGVFDSMAEDLAACEYAVRTIVNGGRYWSASVWEQIRRYQSHLRSPARALTLTEEVVLSVVGDGSDDVVAAKTLGLSPMTVSTVRRNLHRKLAVQHRGELVRVAAQHGYVRFTAEGVVRPGFALLQAAYQAHRGRRAPDASAAAVASADVAV